MSVTSIKLDDLLAPIDVDTFFRQRWEQMPLVVSRDDERHYGDLFSSRDLDAVICHSRPHFDAAAFDAAAARATTYLRGLLDPPPSGSPGDQPSIAELRQHYEQGKSLVVMAMHERWPAVAELCRQLEAVFRSPVHANLYLTPPGSQGFAAHFDTHEVFVLQLEGAKHWRLFGAAAELPLAADAVPLAKRPKQPTQEASLKAGDLLYIPRGHVHEAATSDAASLHLTLGVNVYRWADLLRHALASLARHDVEFRRAIPGGAMPDDRDAAKRQFQRLAERLAAAAADGLFERANDSLAAQFIGQLKMLPCGQFTGHDKCGELGLDTVVARQPAAICRVVESAGGVAIEFPGNRVAGPARIGPALRFVAAAGEFTARDLPGELSDEGKLVLVRRLVREGLLRVVGRSAPPFLCGAFSEGNHANDVATGQLAETVGHAGGQGLV